MPTPLPARSGPPSPSGQRLAWLDALRGVAALAVVLEHMLYRFVPVLRPYWMNLGIYGVMVFFLVSGYIIPASLENRGDVRAFWVGRLFRLYPLYLLIIVVVLLSIPLVPPRDALTLDLATAAAHATMLIDMVGAAGLADTMWTLSYEMAFYLLVTALFVGGLHRRSGLWAVVFAVAALGAGLLLVTPLPDRVPASLVSFGVMAVGLALVIAGSGRVRAAGALMVGGLAVVLVLVGGRVPWLGPAILAVMFTGTVLYRWERGQISRPWAIAVVAALLAVVPFFAARAGWWADPPVWLVTMAFAAGSFALAMALRHRAVPRALAWLGVVSYSIYLVHNPLLKLFLAVYGDPRLSPVPVQAALGVAYLAVVLALSWLTYRTVERPMQALGRRLARSLPPAAVETPQRTAVSATNLG
ncbi:acyltransferase family protein [Sphaerisporangium aureirubrum]|uniref:Acyltransferase family protein n=1 Tax=Sphaerisporangium aureirubrum TaxID=1544736 RepID=A0ABW1NF74_9ACTN